MAFHEQKLVTVVTDLVRFTQSVSGMDSLEMARLIHRVYEVSDAAIGDRGGRVVKYLGDGCLAVFPADAAVAALDAVEAVAAELPAINTEFGVELELGVNVHLCSVAEGEFGAHGHYDVIGMGLIHTFRMGAGAGIRISEPVYRKLPSDRRSAWAKHQPPATYTRQAS